MHKIAVFCEKYIFNRINYLCFFVIYLSFRFLLNDGKERITQMIFFMYSFGFLLYRVINKKINIFDRKYFFGYFLVISGLITILINKKIDFIGFRAIAMYIINFILLMNIDDIKDINKEIKIIVSLILVLCTLHSVVSFFGFVTDRIGLTNLGFYNYGRLNGIIYLTYTGEIALIGIGSSIYLLSIDKISKYKLLLILSIIINFVVMFLTQSRCSIYGFVFCLFLLIVLNVYLYGTKKIIINSILYLLAFIIIVSIFVYISARFEIINLRKIGIYSSGRLSLWKAFLAVFEKQNIVFGMGPSRFVEVYRHQLADNGLPAFIDFFKDENLAAVYFKDAKFFTQLLTHSEYLRQLILFGIIGLSIFLLFIIFALKRLGYIIIYLKKRYVQIEYLIIFYFIYPLFSALAENMFSITNSPRHISSFTFFFITPYIISIFINEREKNIDDIQFN